MSDTERPNTRTAINSSLHSSVKFNYKVIILWSGGVLGCPRGLFCCCSSVKCHGRCIQRAVEASNRFSDGGCTLCCLADIDGDGFITKQELSEGYDAFCGQDEDGIRGKYTNLCTFCGFSFTLPLCLSVL